MTMSEKSVKFRRPRTPYTQVANAALRDKRMSLAVRGFFAMLLSFPDDKDHSISYIAKCGNISKETVYKYLRLLESIGYLTREQQTENGKFGTNIYIFHDIPEPNPCRNFSNTEMSNTTESNTETSNTENPCTKEETLRKNIPPISPQGDESAEMFDRFWMFYRDTYCAVDHSRAGSKAKAKKAWEKLGVTKDLAYKIRAYLESKMRTEWWKRGIGIQHASTLLNAIASGDVDLIPVMPAIQLSAPDAPSPDPPPTREEDRWLQ